MMASDKDVTIKKFNKRTREVYFNVFGNTVTLKFTRDNELVVDRRHYITPTLEKSLATLEDYLSRIGLVRYGSCTYRFANYLSIAALKIVHTLLSPGVITADTYLRVSNRVDTYIIPASMEGNPDARYARIVNAEGRRALEMIVNDNGYRAEVLYEDGYMPLFSVTIGADASIVKYALHAAIDAYKTTCNDPIDDDCIDVSSDDYYKFVFDHLKPTNRPEFNMNSVTEREAPTPREIPVKESTVNIRELLASADKLQQHLPIAVCIGRATLKYDGLYYTLGLMSGYSTDCDCTLARTQFYQKRPVERDNVTPMHLSVVVPYGVVTTTEPENIDYVECDGMAVAEFRKLLSQYIKLLRN